VDLWLWRASRDVPDREPATPFDDYPFQEPLYKGLLRDKTKPPPDFLTARAAGNPNAGPHEPHTAGNLVAQGFGTVTFRPKTSQQVTARAAWKDGQWSVVLRRPLAVGDDGLGLASDQPCSIAFAVWDGAANDRNGQKLVSIWHDLNLE
jgi:hypothetical protein